MTDVWKVHAFSLATTLGVAYISCAIFDALYLPFGLLAALAQAQVGIPMGIGTDVAMESAGVTRVKGDLRGIVRVRKRSRAAITNALRLRRISL